MVRQVENALHALLHVSVRSIVLKLASASRPAPCGEPSFVANAAIEALIRRSGIPFAIVRPTMYLDNLLKPSARAEIAERGVFSPPIASNQRIAWTSTDDCALATILLLEQDLYGGDHLVSGPESVTGDELAARLSAGLGKPITYHAEPLDVFERDVDAAMGPGMGAAYRIQVPLLPRAPGRCQPDTRHGAGAGSAARLHTHQHRSVGAAEMPAFPMRARSSPS
ncbi:NmrA family NAD(P)-binding protein [Sphingomonas sp. NCPPB 2930]|uniref:NmrA family NAD(P)-binding protein n=1 Tax=Sphingomonas sp. NCPPB 2930 TaxID=3162788 RepID=UPI0036DB7041